MKNQFEFKPFDQVLVRDDDQSIWKAGIYSHFENNHNVSLLGPRSPKHTLKTNQN